MELWELVAREAIRDLVAGYAHAADRGRFAEVAALFADDGILDLPDGRSIRGRAGIEGFLTGTGADLRDATTVPWIRHHVSSHRIAVQDQASAEGSAYFFVVTERGPDHWGRYRDRYVSVAGEWRFAHRSVRVDGRAPGAWAASRKP
jgi:hypothetical protein